MTVDRGWACGQADAEGSEIRGREVKVPAPAWLLKFVDSRQWPRHRCDGVAALYWNGGVAQARPIREISLGGALIEAPDRYRRGTLLRMTFRLQPPAVGANQPARAVEVWARVVRPGADGFCVQFQFANRSERRHMEALLESLRGEVQ